MESGMTLHSKELAVPAGVEVVTDVVVASVIAPVEEEVTAAEGADAAEAPAAAEAK